MTVKQLLAMEIGTKAGGGFALTIKTVKKRWKVANFSWVHQVLLTDLTGDILADVERPNNIPFIRDTELLVVVCEMQAAEAGGHKLAVHEWRKNSDTEPRVWEAREPESVVRSKIRCKLVCAYLCSGTTADEEEVLFWEDFIITGRKR